GTILYFLLTTRPPVAGQTLEETLARVRDQVPDPPSRIHPHTPAVLEAICLRCLAKEPHQRYPSAAELADDLRRFLDESSPASTSQDQPPTDRVRTGATELTAQAPRSEVVMVSRDLVPGYLLGEEIGRSRMGVVFEARHFSFGVVAVRVITPALAVG